MLIKNNNIHIAHGLNPSTKPNTTASNGNDTFLAFTSPNIGKVNLLSLGVSGSFGFSI